VRGSARTSGVTGGLAMTFHSAHNVASIFNGPACLSARNESRSSGAGGVKSVKFYRSDLADAFVKCLARMSRELISASPGTARTAILNAIANGAEQSPLFPRMPATFTMARNYPKTSPRARRLRRTEFSRAIGVATNGTETRSRFTASRSMPINHL